jgi:DoxX-like family
MKRHKWMSWTITGLMAALMLLGAVPDVLRLPGAVSVFEHLGYPSYLLLFLGTAKLLGVVAVLVPGVPRIKEWAFAGLAFDVSGALYSHLSVGDPPTAWMPAALGLVLVGSSYFAYRVRLDQDPLTRESRMKPGQGEAIVSRLQLNT